jgi:DNA-binding PadR family transcriptional regulator
MSTPRSNPNDLLRGAIDLVVLSVLGEGPMYGYLIIKRVAGRSEGSIRLTPGALYPLLHRMEKQGLLLSSWEEIRAEGNDAAGTGRKRKWYRLSAKGGRRLEQRVAAHRAYQAVLESFLPEGSG